MRGMRSRAPCDKCVGRLYMPPCSIQASHRDASLPLPIHQTYQTHSAIGDVQQRAPKVRKQIEQAAALTRKAVKDVEQEGSSMYHYLTNR